jgi:hypothetical protein
MMVAAAGKTVALILSSQFAISLGAMNLSCRPMIATDGWVAGVAKDRMRLTLPQGARVRRREER